MTTIFICNDIIYADTRTFKGSEKFTSFSKIMALTEPLKASWVPNKHDRDALLETKDPWKDTIHGYAASGNNRCIAAFIQKMVEFNGELYLLYQLYAAAYKQLLYSEETSFSVVLIGETADYCFSFNVEGIGFTKNGRDDPFAFGSGQEYVLFEYMRSRQPLRAMYNALYYDRLSGGMIDMWLLPTKESPHFRRMAICEERSMDAILGLLNKNDPIHPDLILREYCLTMAKTAFKEGERHGVTKSRTKAIRRPKSPTTTKKRKPQ